VPLALAWLWLRVLGLSDALDVPASPVMPDLYPPAAGGIAVGVAAVALMLAGWFGVRPMLLRRIAVTGSPAAGGLGAATGLLVAGLAAIVWVPNPYAAALLLPAAHLWLLAASPGSRLRGVAGALAIAGGLLLPALVVLHYARALGLDPLSLAWLGVLITADGHVSPAAVLVLGLWLACLAGLVTIMRTRRRVEAAVPPEPLRTRGPAGYAGPGSLGGTESALRR
jgi:hypothetical protein